MLGDFYFFFGRENFPSAMVIQSPQTCISTPLLGKEKGGLFNGFGQTVIFADFAQKKGKEEIQKNYSEEVLIKVKFFPEFLGIICCSRVSLC